MAKILHLLCGGDDSRVYELIGYVEHLQSEIRKMKYIEAISDKDSEGFDESLIRAAKLICNFKGVTVNLLRDKSRVMVKINAVRMLYAWAKMSCYNTNKVAKYLNTNRTTQYNSFKNFHLVSDGEKNFIKTII